MKFKRFTKLTFLKQIGRPLLDRFLNRFAKELAARNVALPSGDSDDDDYYRALARLALTPDGLPDSLIEAMFEIEELATPEGQEQLEAAARRAQLALVFDEESTHADIALQVWLADPRIVARSHNEARLHRLSSFEYFGSKTPVDRSDPFTIPDAELMRRLTADLDRWFAGHQRGHETTHVVAYPMEGEVWFVIRHGDTFSRMPMLKGREVKVLHFRPTKDDVVVYVPDRDEIRIHARTKGERELYRVTFGRRLFGEDQHFSERKAYTLEPLRSDGTDALDCTGMPGIKRIVLRQYEMAWDTNHREFVVRKATDIFAAAAQRKPDREPIPPTGQLVKAVLDVYFANAKRSRSVEIRPPNVLKVRRHADSAPLQRWLSERGFRSATAEREVDEPRKAGWTLKIGNPVITGGRSHA
ncbi:hypothetical protein GC207_14935 [bacterium]|nr:hypothetical protein [bacterium]